MERICDFSGHLSGVLQLEFNRDADSLVSLGNGDCVRLLSLRKRKELVCFDYQKPGRYQHVRFGPDDRPYAVGTYQRHHTESTRVDVADVCKKKILASQKLGSMGVPHAFEAPHSMALNPDCNLVAGIYHDSGRAPGGGDIVLWRLAKSLLGRKLVRGKEVSSTSFKFSPFLSFNATGNVLAVCQSNFQQTSKGYFAMAGFYYVDPDTLALAPIETVEIPDSTGVHSIHFTADNRAFLGNDGSGLNTFRLWAKTTRRYVSVEHSAAVFSSAVSPDGTLLATGDKTGLVKVSSLADGSETGRIQAQSQRFGVARLAFSSDGSRLALAADRIEVWRLH